MSVAVQPFVHWERIDLVNLTDSNMDEDIQLLLEVVFY